mmetsp:Transcript_57137/g.153573  ORF Transcript_57137/g.153573 Transcript_57137/m.153573 type:complete len:305 (-) Transcript_57137:159-1073(-)
MPVQIVARHASCSILQAPNADEDIIVLRREVHDGAVVAAGGVHGDMGPVRVANGAARRLLPIHAHGEAAAHYARPLRGCRRCGVIGGLRRQRRQGQGGDICGATEALKALLREGGALLGMPEVGAADKAHRASAPELPVELGHEAAIVGIGGVATLGGALAWGGGGIGGSAIGVLLEQRPPPHALRHDQAVPGEPRCLLPRRRLRLRGRLRRRGVVGEEQAGTEAEIQHLLGCRRVAVIRKSAARHDLAAPPVLGVAELEPAEEAALERSLDVGVDLELAVLEGGIPQRGPHGIDGQVQEHLLS